MEKPIEVPEEQIRFLYRFADNLDEVNWQARYKPNPEFLGMLLPNIYSFLDKNIRKVTYDPTSLRVVVGISGGLDSSVSTILVAETIMRAKDLGTALDTSLVLIAFKNMSEEDLENARKFAEVIGSKYKSIPIEYIERDLTGNIRDLDSFTDEMITSSNIVKVYSGEMPSRFMTSVVLDFANKTEHCMLDTTNGSEVILGEIVIGAGAECAPIADLYKSQVYDLAGLIDVPDFILSRPPINSTFGHDKVATYFAETPEGLTPREAYQILDPVLYYLFERKYQSITVARRLGHSFKFVDRISRRIHNQDHRRDIPFFVANDRRKSYPRDAISFSNHEVINLMNQSLAT